MARDLKASTGMRLVVIAAYLALVACRPPGYGKGDDDGDVDAAAPTGDGGTGDGMHDGDTAASCDKSFRLDGHSLASSVWLTGEFVSWADSPGAGAVALTLGVEGAWTGAHTFDAGPHQYKFIVDGSNWITDPTNPNEIDDGMGHRNSVYTCVP